MRNWKEKEKLKKWLERCISLHISMQLYGRNGLDHQGRYVLIQPPLCIIFSPGGSLACRGFLRSLARRQSKKAAAVPEFSGAAAAIFCFEGWFTACGPAVPRGSGGSAGRGRCQTPCGSRSRPSGPGDRWPGHRPGSPKR